MISFKHSLKHVPSIKSHDRDHLPKTFCALKFHSSSCVVAVIFPPSSPTIKTRNCWTMARTAGALRIPSRVRFKTLSRWEALSSESSSADSILAMRRLSAPRVVTTSYPAACDGAEESPHRFLMRESMLLAKAHPRESDARLSGC